MGGKALNIETKRLPVEEFLILEKEVLEKLSIKYPSAKSTRYFHSKEDFGDLDVLVIGEPVVYEAEKAVMSEYLTETFNTKDIFFNTGVVSFEYKNFQVDLILVKETELETAHFYYSYNDLNNLIGIIAKQFGLSLGFDGLTVYLSDYTNQEHAKYVVSKDPRKMYEFLGLDYDRYLLGFNNLEEIFNYIISSKYFTSSAYLYENLDSKNRTRNRKRKTFHTFLKWLDENNVKRSFRFRKDKKYYYESIEKYFNANVGIEVEKLNTKVAFRKNLSDKFNGDIIKKLIPGLSGVALGKFITEFKDTKENFVQWVEDTPMDSIEVEILKYNSSFN